MVNPMVVPIRHEIRFHFRLGNSLVVVVVVDGVYGYENEEKMEILLKFMHLFGPIFVLFFPFFGYFFKHLGGILLTKYVIGGSW